ncbi:MAG: calcium-binding protein [Pseudomonadota bacterium]
MPSYIISGKTTTPRTVSGDSQYVYVGTSGTIEVDGAASAITTKAANTVYNYGLLEADAATIKSSDTPTVQNYETGTIRSKSSDALRVTNLDGGLRLTNQGLMDGKSNGVSVNASSSLSSSITNYAGAKILGRTGSGIDVEHTATGTMQVLNYGKTVGLQEGVNFEGDESARSYVYNYDGGEIRSAGTAVDGSNGFDYVANYGKIQDTAAGGAAVAMRGGNDSLVNKGTIIGDVKMGSGDDYYYGAGEVTGRLMGGAGDDVFSVLFSQQKVVGGTGIDTVYSSASYQLSDASTENLWGQGSENIRLVGNSSDNMITGNKGDNKIFGLDGKDSLNGSYGDDDLYGGNGRDVADYSWDNTALKADLARGIAYSDKSGVDKLVDIESLNGGRGNDILKGDAGANTLKGGYGNDTIAGRGGNDRINGGEGNDMLSGNAGADVFVFADKFGDDVVRDFQVGQPGEKIHLAGVDGIDNFADLKQYHLSDSKGDALIEDDFGNSILLEGVSVDQLSAGDFIF